MREREKIKERERSVGGREEERKRKGGKREWMRDVKVSEGRKKKIRKRDGKKKVK